MIGALSRKVGEILGKACRMEDVTILKVATYRSVYIYIYVYDVGVETINKFAPIPIVP